MDRSSRVSMSNPTLTIILTPTTTTTPPPTTTTPTTTSTTLPSTTLPITSTSYESSTATINKQGGSSCVALVSVIGVLTCLLILTLLLLAVVVYYFRKKLKEPKNEISIAERASPNEYNVKDLRETADMENILPKTHRGSNFLNTAPKSPQNRTMEDYDVPPKKAEPPQPPQPPQPPLPPSKIKKNKKVNEAETDDDNYLIMDTKPETPSGEYYENYLLKNGSTEKDDIYGNVEQDDIYVNN